MLTLQTCVDKPTNGTLIRGPAGDPLQIGLPCIPRIWTIGSPFTWFTLAGCSSSRKRSHSACRAEDGGSSPTAPKTGWAGTVGVVCKPWKSTAF